MCSTAEIRLEIAHKKIDELQREVDDCRTFIRSVDRALTPPKNEKEKQNIRHELHNLRTMCNYIMHRYHQPTNQRVITK